jgi:hypothetical protein
LCNIRIKNLDHKKLRDGVWRTLRTGRPSNILEISWFMIDPLLIVVSTLEHTQLYSSPTSPSTLQLSSVRVDAHTEHHGRRNFKDTNPLMSSLLVIFVLGGVAIL